MKDFTLSEMKCRRAVKINILDFFWVQVQLLWEMANEKIVY
jgi:hypothetical protein